MQKRGFLVRFIDVGLILLVAFIAISEIEIVAQIPMPGSDEEAPPPEERRRTIVVVKVYENGTYSLSRVEAEEHAPDLPDLDTLEDRLVEARDLEAERDNDIVVIIEAEKQSQIQWTVDVLDLCDRLGIPKNINSGALKL